MQRNIKNNPVSKYLLKQNKESSFFKEAPEKDLKLVVVIPAYKEEDIETTISSLYDCIGIKGSIEIIVFVNGNSEDDAKTIESNLLCLEKLHDLQTKYTHPLRKLLFFENLSIPVKKAGVGVARKTLMDEACFRFNMIGEPNGIIVNLDADCIVEPNYFEAIAKFFETNPSVDAVSIHFEHRFLDPVLKSAIVQYELHLRYFIGMQKLISLPFAYQTIGSSMACRTEGYARVGGMNTRKAGEDFYFLHKFIKIDKCGKLYTTTVYPSDRISDRVPFGTGKAVGDKIHGKANVTYNPKSFIILEAFLKNLDDIYENGFQDNYHGDNSCMKDYLKSINFKKRINEIKDNTKSFSSFVKRFYQFFDAFLFMKYLHFMRDCEHKDVSLERAIVSYFDKIGLEFHEKMEENLNTIRKFDKSMER